MNRDPLVPKPEDLTHDQLWELARADYTSDPWCLVEFILEFLKANPTDSPLTISLEDQRDWYRAEYEEESVTDEELLWAIKDPKLIEALKAARKEAE